VVRVHGDLGDICIVKNASIYAAINVASSRCVDKAHKNRQETREPDSADSKTELAVKEGMHKSEEADERFVANRPRFGCYS
jgi:hypothetical protein